MLKKLPPSPAKSWLAADLTYDGGYMWGMELIGNTIKLERLNLSNGAVSTFTAPTGVKPSTTFGAAWTFGNGNLGFQSNSTGEIFEIAVANPSAATPTFTFLSTYSGPVAQANNDGAACAPKPVDLGIQKTAHYWQATYEGDANNAPFGPTACASETFTVCPAGPSISSTSPSGSAEAGTSFTDRATLTGGAVPSGTITFDVFGPNDTTCADAPAATATATVNAGNGTYTSGGVTLNVPGTYYWEAVYGGHSNNNASPTTPCGESFTVSPASPTITSTTPSGSGAAGSGFTDSATLSGGALPGGTITFAVYGPGDSTCSNAPAGSATANVSGNGSFTSGPAVVLDAVGTYYWRAAYGGDADNNPSPTTACGESFTVTKGVPSITSTTPSASAPIGSSFTDSATLSGGAVPTGTVVFKLYGPNNSTCAGSALQTVTASVSGDGPYVSPPVTPSQVGNYFWEDQYTGDANNNTSALTACGEEFTVEKAASSLALAPTSPEQVGSSFSESAMLSGGAGPTGSISFDIYAQNASCAGTPASAATATVNGDGSYTGSGLSVATPGTYDLQATYSGDGDNAAFATTCGATTVTITPVPPPFPNGYVVDNSAVEAISTSTNTLSARVTGSGTYAFSSTYEKPQLAALTPDGAFVYLANYSPSTPPRAWST